MSTTVKKNLSGLPLEALQETLGLPPFRVKQIFSWIARGAASFQDMTDLSIPLREELASQFSLYCSAISRKLEDEDGTVKLQIRLHDKGCIETVLLSDAEGRRTACVSTQLGCPMGCVFCKTATLFPPASVRNLDSAEIVEQFLHLRSIQDPDQRGIANIVVMGMGEPLLNLPELRKALAVLTAPEGLGLSRRRVTVSTCGIIAGVRDLADHGPGVRLAVSLTTADAALRERLMPAARANPLPALKEALLYYQQKLGHRITLEAALLGGVNTRTQDTEALALFAKGLEVLVNLIPWNPVDGMVFEGVPLQEPSRAELRAFMSALEQRGLKVTLRLRKGRRISGACGTCGQSLEPSARRAPPRRYSHSD
jgi:23S rRNA (adenine2503-C2)-methyltransferase